MRVQGDPNPSKNGVFYTLGDQLGSTSVVTDASGNKVGEMRYMPWGETRNTSGNVTTSYHYTGQREDVGIGLYYYNARWYDPQLGRFTQADTIIPSPFIPSNYDRYQYVDNNPILYNDNSGHCIICIGALGGAIGGAIYGYGSQVVRNLHQGMDLGKALTTNIDPNTIIFYSAAGAALGSGIGIGMAIAAPYILEILSGLSGYCASNPESCGTIPEDAEEAYEKINNWIMGLTGNTYEEVLKKAVARPESDIAVIGILDPTEQNGYLEYCMDLKATCLAADYDTWRKLKDAGAWWDAVNKPFLDSIIYAQKDVYLSDTWQNLQAHGGLAWQEYEYLLAHHYHWQSGGKYGMLVPD